MTWSFFGSVATNWEEMMWQRYLILRHSKQHLFLYHQQLIMP